ncbi:Esterase FE4 [Anthophora retusa]
MAIVQLRLASNVQSLCRARCSVHKLARAWFTMSEPIVTVKQGKLRGVVLKSALGSSYIAFREIPFAAPPIGDLRFKDPQPPAPWTDIRDTSQIKGTICPQMREFPPIEVIGDEDCLYLNVYTNSLNQSKPVMFWIHGGAFVVGGSSFTMTRADYLLERDVVVVTTNYRLGAFGFLNLGHPSAPGNQGLKDIITALKWVQENIANFGGDPTNVTIFGVSAGGALSHTLLLSPSAKGLFHKAILQSGLLTCPWSTNQSRPERGFKLAELLGKKSNDPVEVLKFLRSVTAKDIVKTQSCILSAEATWSYHLGFGLNSDVLADDPVLPRPLEEYLANELDIPVIIGCTSHEFVMFLKNNSEVTMNIHNQYLPLHVKNLAAVKKLGTAEIQKLTNRAKRWYFDGKPISTKNIASFIEFMTDVYFSVPAKVLLEKRIKQMSSPTYFYRYSYVGKEKAHTDLLIKRLIHGASHVDEIPYLFYLPLCKTEKQDPPAIGTKDRITLERMTRLWANFAKTGDPTSVQDEYIQTTWKPATVNEPCYLDIGEELKLLPTKPHILDSE